MMQEGWGWCSKCGGLAPGRGEVGVCPASGAHDTSTSGRYALALDTATAAGQRGWRACSKCQGLAFGSDGVCPAGGAHEGAASSEYTVPHGGGADPVGPELQAGWRWCERCHALFFSGAQSVCPAGGAHAGLASGRYAVTHRATAPRSEQIAEEVYEAVSRALGRALRCAASPADASLPGAADSAERVLHAYLLGQPALLARISSRVGASEAAFPVAHRLLRVDAAGSPDLMEPLSAVPRAVRWRAPSAAADGVGHVASALSSNDITVRVRRIECLQESQPAGEDELHVMLRLFGASGITSAVGPGYVGQFRTGGSHPWNWPAGGGLPPPDRSHPPPPVAQMSGGGVHRGDSLRLTVNLFDADPIDEGFKDFAELVHQVAKEALYWYVMYESGGDAATAQLAKESAEFLGRRIAAGLAVLEDADHLGWAAVTWSYADTPSRGVRALPPVDIVSSRHRSHYRVELEVASNFDPLPDVAITDGPAMFQQPKPGLIYFEPDDPGPFTAIAAGEDAETGQPVLWAVDRHGQVRRRVGVTGAWTAVPGAMASVAVGWTLDANGMAYRFEAGALARQGWRFVSLSAGAEGEVWGAQADGSVWRHARVRPTTQGAVSGAHRVTAEWARLPGAMAVVGVADKREIWGVSPQGRPHRWDGSTAFVPADAGGPVLAALGVAPGDVWGVDGGGQAWHFFAETWTLALIEVTGPRGGRAPLVARQVCPTGARKDPGVVFALGRDGRVHRWRPGTLPR